MSDQSSWARMAVQPGLCRWCRHPFLNETRHGAIYLRCTRATWDDRMVRYPQLPVQECAGFERDKQARL